MEITMVYRVLVTLGQPQLKFIDLLAKIYWSVKFIKIGVSYFTESSQNLLISKNLIVQKS